MGELRKLKLAEAAPRDAEKDLNQAVEELKEFLAKPGKNAGYALIGYRRIEDGKVALFTNYHTAETLDAYILPDLVKAEIARVRDKD